MAQFAEQLVGRFSHLDPVPSYAAVCFYPALHLGSVTVTLFDPPSDTGEYPTMFPFVADRRVLDGHWWQLLGRGHREFLGDWPQGAVALDEDHVTLTIGRALDWAAFGPEHDEAQRLARQTLAPLIAHDAADVQRVMDGAGPG